MKERITKMTNKNQHRTGEEGSVLDEILDSVSCTHKTQICNLRPYCERRRQRDQKFDAIFGYIVRWRSTWTTRSLVKNKKGLQTRLPSLKTCVQSPGHV